MAKKTGTVNIQEIAKAAAIEALKLQKNEERERIRKNRFHNTELLLKNYLGLVEHFKNSIEKASDIMDVDDLVDIGADDIIIQSIRRSRARSIVMISQLETCLEILRIRMASKIQDEKYEVIKLLYLNPELINKPWADRIQIVTTKIQCSEASVHRWKNDMISELSVLLFGVDGLKLEV